PEISMMKKKTSTRMRLVRTLRAPMSDFPPDCMRPNPIKISGWTERTRRRSGDCLLDQGHFLAGHEFFDIDQNQHALAHGADAREVLGRERRTELRCGADLHRLQNQHIGLV